MHLSKIFCYWLPNYFEGYYSIFTSERDVVLFLQNLFVPLRSRVNKISIFVSKWLLHAKRCICSTMLVTIFVYHLIPSNTDVIPFTFHPSRKDTATFSDNWGPRVFWSWSHYKSFISVFGRIQTMFTRTISRECNRYNSSTDIFWC